MVKDEGRALNVANFDGVCLSAMGTNPYWPVITYRQKKVPSQARCYASEIAKRVPELPAALSANVLPMWTFAPLTSKVGEDPCSSSLSPHR